MRPVLFQWKGLRVWSYPALLYFGLVAGVAVGNLAAHAARVDAFRTYLATLILIVPALVGARLLYVAAHWQAYRHNLARVWNRREGGYIMYGGLPAVLLLSIPLLAVLRLNFRAFWDVAAFTILAGMIFTRVGCLMNGCCAGRPSNAWFSLYLPGPGGQWRSRIPTQAMEAGWAVVILVSAALFWHRMPFPGALFLFVAASYACGRFVMEFARERESHSKSLTLGHVISLVILASSVSTLTVCWRM